MFSPNATILLSNTAALSPRLAEGSGAVNLHPLVSSSITSVESRSVKPPLLKVPPVTRSTYKSIIYYLLIFNIFKPHIVSLISLI